MTASPSSRSVQDIDAVALADFVEEWGVVDLATYRPLDRRLLRSHERFLAQYAQQLRCEAAAKGHAEETAAFFGDGEHRGAGAERRILAADFAREAAAAAAYGREQPPVHGTASGWLACAGKGERRCEACRSYQRQRSRANRLARRQRELCTGTRSSYDAGCRCTRCTAANSSGCRRWRARSTQPIEVAA